ncbi:trimeric intracellular cation channel family protein [soil metagenome]
MKPVSATLLLVLDLLGTFLFAMEGASTAVQHELDLLGIMVLAFVTALGGGIVRDLLIGSVPPNSIEDWRYAATALFAAFVVFAGHTAVGHIPYWLLITLDAAGLGFFAIAGAAKALDFGINPLLAILLGGVTGVGGGTIRDIFLAQIPGVLRAEIYAAAALLGAAVLVLGLKLKLRPAFASTLGILVCFALRMAAVHEHWNLPRVLGR